LTHAGTGKTENPYLITEVSGKSTWERLANFYA